MKKNVLVAGVSVGAFLASLLIGAVLILLNGDSPALAYASLFSGAFGSAKGIVGTLSSATPLIFTGLGVAVAFKAGMPNIGAEGQLYMGGMAAAVVGIYAPLSGPVHLLASIAAAVVAGGLYGLLPAVLKVKTGTNVVVTTLMLNYVAKLFTSYLVNYPLKAAGTPIGMTEVVKESARLPVIYEGSRFNLGFVLAIIMAIMLFIYFRNTRGGYEMRMVGENPEFAEYTGIFAGRKILQSMFISGALAGIGGAVLVLGIQYKFVQNISPGYGFDGLTIALMAGFNSIVVLPISILFGALRSGGLSMELLTNVPSELSSVIQSIVILFLASKTSFTDYLEEFINRIRFNKEQRSERKG